MRPSLLRYCQSVLLWFGKVLDVFSYSNVAGQWNPVFMQPLPEEEIVIRDDQDPRVSL